MLVQHARAATATATHLRAHGRERFIAVGTLERFELPRYFMKEEAGIPQRSIYSVWVAVFFLFGLSALSIMLGRRLRYLVDHHLIKQCTSVSEVQQQCCHGSLQCAVCSGEQLALEGGKSTHVV